MEAIFSNPGFSHISAKITKHLSLKNMSNLSKTSKSMATSLARFWFQRFLNKFQLDLELEELYTNLMAYPNPEIQQSLGYIMRISVEHGLDYKLKHDLISPTNCPLDLSMIFNQGPLAKLILNQFLRESIDFSRVVKLAIVGDSSTGLLRWVLTKWEEIYPSVKKNFMLESAAMCGDPLKFKTLLDFGLVPCTNHGIRIGNYFYTPMERAVSKGHIEIVKMLLPFYKDKFERPMLLAIWNENNGIIEVLFDQCKVPSSQDMKHLSIKSWKYTYYSWSYYAAIYGKVKAFQKLIALEDKSPVPSLQEEQFLYLSEIIQRGLTLSKRYVYDVNKLES